MIIKLAFISPLGKGHLSSCEKYYGNLSQSVAILWLATKPHRTTSKIREGLHQVTKQERNKLAHRHFVFVLYLLMF